MSIGLLNYAPPVVREWPSRIVKFEYARISDLTPSPYHCFIHEHDELRALGYLIENFGWVEAISGNLTTGNIINGYARVRAAQYQNIEVVPVLWSKISEDEEEALVLWLNSLGKMAHRDEKKINEYITGLFTTRGLSKLKKLFTFMVMQNVIPFGKNKLMTRTELRDLPLEKQECARRATRRGQELWAFGDGRFLGSPEECDLVISAWEEKTGLEAIKLLPKED
jgi:hypothetical protein